jgi:hypothetical protein
MSTGLARSVQTRLVSHQWSFDGETLAGALRATFARRGTEIPAAPPIALTAAFAEVEGKQVQWAAFVRRSRLATAAPANLEAAVAGIAAFVGPPLAAVQRGQRFLRRWHEGGAWEAVP